LVSLLKSADIDSWLKLWKGSASAWLRSVSHASQAPPASLLFGRHCPQMMELQWQMRIKALAILTKSAEAPFQSDVTSHFSAASPHLSDSSRVFRKLR
jgi:hypothetical protein